MINFILVDDDQKFVEIVKALINDKMLKTKFDYKIHTFYDYDKKFFDGVEKIKNNKIYILDIETKSASGIDVARRIRDKDVDSVIIFVTSHNELGSEIVKEQLMFLTFICKFTNFEINLQNAITKSLEILNHKTTIRFTDTSVVYTIPIKDILYVTRDSIDRKCIIKTDYGEYRVGKTLADIKEIANGELVQTHRACLINEDRVRTYSKNDNTVKFDNGETIDLISSNYWKELAK